MADVAVPNDDRCVRLDNLKAVLAVYRSGHCDVMKMDWSECNGHRSEGRSCIGLAEAIGAIEAVICTPKMRRIYLSALGRRIV